MSGPTDQLTRKQEQGLRTRARILDAATQLIGDQGYAATSISAVCRAAGVQAPSIYWAFGSKEGLFAAVLERAATDWFLSQAALTEASSIDGVWAALRELRHAFDEQPEFLRILLVCSLERRDGDPEILETARGIRALGAQLVADALEPHVAVADPDRRRSIAADVGRLAILLFDGAFVARQIEPDTTDLDDVFETIVTCMQATLRVKEQAA